MSGCRGSYCITNVFRLKQITILAYRAQLVYEPFCLCCRPGLSLNKYLIPPEACGYPESLFNELEVFVKPAVKEG